MRRSWDPRRHVRAAKSHRLSLPGSRCQARALPLAARASHFPPCLEFRAQLWAHSGDARANWPGVWDVVWGPFCERPAGKSRDAKPPFVLCAPRGGRGVGIKIAISELVALDSQRRDMDVDASRPRFYHPDKEKDPKRRLCSRIWNLLSKEGGGGGVKRYDNMGVMRKRLCGP